MNRARWIAGLGVLLATSALVAGCFLLSRPPIASFVVHYNNTEDPLVVDLDASASSDPDGDEIATYWWTFGEAGVDTLTPLVHYTGRVDVPIIRVRFAFEGEHEVTLLVTDERGTNAEAVHSETIVLPNLPVGPTL